MIYNEKADILVEVEIEDDMGGIKKELRVAATIKCKVAPYVVKDVDSKGLLKEYSKNKLFTKQFDFVDNIYSNYIIRYNGKMYNKINVLDVKKCLIIEMERI